MNIATKTASYLPLRTVRVKQAVPVLRAIEGTPNLASLAHLAEQSAHCLHMVTPLIPLPLRSGVYAGPLQSNQWCLLAANSAVAAKLRQLAPALAAHLRTHGHEVQEIRIKIAMQPLR